MEHLGPIEVPRRSGDEQFHCSGEPIGADLLSFWQWSASDIVSNAMRGVLAEYLVAMAVGATGSVREEWAAFDLVTPDGTTIEVKSAAYLQSWHQNRLSKITFACPKTLAWDKETNKQAESAARQADVYVFALLAHTDKPTIDPMDLSQWEFYVVPTFKLDERTRSQQSVTLPSLLALCDEPVEHAYLSRSIDAAADEQRMRSAGVENELIAP